MIEAKRDIVSLSLLPVPENRNKKKTFEKRKIVTHKHSYDSMSS